MSTPLTDTRRLDDATAYRVLRLARRLRYSLACTLEGWDTGLSPEQYFILFRLAERDGRAHRELVDPVLDDRPNITRMVNALVQRGLVERRADAEDGRVKRVFLTPVGRNFFEGLRPRILEERQRIFAGVDPAKLHVFESVLTTIEDRVLPDPG